MQRIISSSKGSILLFAFFFTFTLVVLATVFLDRIVFTNKEAQNEIERAQALNLAEAGINKAIYYLTNGAPNNAVNGSWRTTAYPAAGVTPCTSTDPCTETITSGSDSGTYTIWVENVTSEAPSTDIKIKITSKGTYKAFSRTIQVRVKYNSYLENWWKLNEGSSPSEDSGAKLNDLVWGLSGTAALPAGSTDCIQDAADRCVGSFTYSGLNANSMAATYNAAFPPPSQGFSLSVWYNPTSAPADATTGYLLANNRQTDGIFIYYTIAGGMKVRVRDIRGNTTTGTTSLSIGVGSDLANWHHILMVINPEGTNKLYLNNAEELSGFTYSGRGCFSYVFRLIGAVDEIMYYSRPLTVDEVDLIYDKTPTSVNAYGYVTIVPGSRLEL